jgi:hypothetical protein
MSARSWELVTTNESTVVAKPVLNAIVVEDLERDRRFPNPPCTNESDRFEVFGESDDRLYQFVASETGPGWWGR